MKISFHLVWPEIILNEDTAKIIRERTMEKFEEWADDPSHPIADFKKNVIDIDPSNIWDDVFDDKMANRGRRKRQTTVWLT